MNAKAGKENKANESEAREEGGLVPAILAGVGILAVVGLLVFWPSGDESASTDAGASGDKKGRQAGGRAAARSGSARGGGGVAARSVDDATPGTSVARFDSRLQPPSVGMAPAVPPEEKPPKFRNTEDEIAWYEQKLKQAQDVLRQREKAASRLPRAKQRAEESKTPEAATARYEKSEKVVEANVEKAKAKIAEIERKLAELRGE